MNRQSTRERHAWHQGLSASSARRAPRVRGENKQAINPPPIRGGGYKEYINEKNRYISHEEYQKLQEQEIERQGEYQLNGGCEKM